MRTFLLLCVVASICVCGCDSGSGIKPATAQEKKDFAGGPMPPDARAKFEAAMKQNDANRANAVNKVKSAAGGGAAPGGAPGANPGGGD